ncbi:MAG: hypothetical protein WA843_01205 [Candidatus Saccharimonadales bacterium]
MNPSSNEISLPPPVEQAPVAGDGLAEQRPEQAASGAERGTQVSQAMPPVATIPLPVPPVAAQDDTMSNDVAATSTNVVQSAIKDTDLIEKEWVHKAKQIVERTRDDPYQQSEQLTGVKADYMKKRYNKTIKLTK